jgi:hypothetical protein
VPPRAFVATKRPVAVRSTVTERRESWVIRRQ